MEVWKAAAAVSFTLLVGCRGGSVDTTKDVYEEWEAPEYQLVIVNGEERRVPWKEVSGDGGWFIDVDEDSVVPWTRYKRRVPIVKVEIWARDREGRPVDPHKGPVWRGHFTEYGLNPKYVRTGIMGEAH